MLKNKLFKSMITLILVLSLILALSVTACADGNMYDTWGNRFANFNLVKNGSTGGYVYAAQRIIYEYNGDAAGLIDDAGGVDGIFGSGTEKAVRYFQQHKFETSSQVDGIVGQYTWRGMRDSMYADSNFSGPLTIFRHAQYDTSSSIVIVTYQTQASTMTYSVRDENGTLVNFRTEST